MLTPRENLTLFGHQAARDTFLKAFHSPHFPHAWLINGPFGIGKATFSFHMARYILSGRSNGQTLFSLADPLHRRIVANSHGDLLTVGGEGGQEIGVDAIRQFNATLNQTPAEGGWRVVIIDGADGLNRNASNALLKRLEEPPVKTVFLLSTTLPGRLLPTIRSRCQALVLSPLEEEEMKQVLMSQGLNVPDFLSFCEGSPGRAMALSTEEGIQFYARLQALFKGEDPTAFIHAYAADDKAYELIEELVRYFVHSQLLAKVSAAPSIFEKQSLDESLEIWEKIAELFDQCRVAQLDRKTTLTCIFARLDNRN